MKQDTDQISEYTVLQNSAKRELLNQKRFENLTRFVPGFLIRTLPEPGLNPILQNCYFDLENLD